MKIGTFVLLWLICVWRICASVSWNYKTFTDKFSNDFERPYQPPEEPCVEMSRKNWRWGIYCGFKSWSEGFKASAANKIQEFLPSPHSELVMGMVLGENRFKLVPTYNDVLKKVGLVHVVVVSGYNISLVFTLLMGVLGSQYKIKNLIVGLFCTFIYAGISGFGVPAVRAWIMGSVAALFKFYGRPAQGTKVLIFSALVLLILSPEQLFSVSFQLSFLATFGVMVLPDALQLIYGRLGFKVGSGFLGDFNTSLSAQLMVNPIISYYFGTISVAALVANPLVLWVVPICTVLGGVLILTAFLSPLLAGISALILYPFLDFFVKFSEFFADFNNSSIQLRSGSAGVIIYYIGLLLLIKVAGRWRVL